MNRPLVAVILTGIFIIAPISGCFGEEEQSVVKAEENLTINFLTPDNAVAKAGEFTSFTLEGNGNAIMTEADALLFVNGTYIKSHSIMAEDEMVFGQILTTPYSTNLNITFMDSSGRSEVIQIEEEKARQS